MPSSVRENHGAVVLGRTIFSAERCCEGAAGGGGTFTVCCASPVPASSSSPKTFLLGFAMLGDAPAPSAAAADLPATCPRRLAARSIALLRFLRFPILRSKLDSGAGLGRRLRE